MTQPVKISSPISILVYHQVGPFKDRKLHRPIHCDVGRFRRQMAWLHWRGYNVISMEAAYKCLFEGATIPPKAVVLTFDDGCDNFREHAWPVLKQYNFPVSMFVVTDLVGKTAGWDKVLGHAPLMTAEAIRALRKEGVHFGAHSMTHPRLALCSPEEARKEIVGSKAELEDILGEAVTDFCYPYGSYNAQVADIVREAGFKLGLTLNRAAANYAPNPFEVPRKGISYGDSLLGYLWKIHMKDVPKRKDGK